MTVAPNYFRDDVGFMLLGTRIPFRSSCSCYKENYHSINSNHFINLDTFTFGPRSFLRHSPKLRPRSAAARELLWRPCSARAFFWVRDGVWARERARGRHPSGSVTVCGWRERERGRYDCHADDYPYKTHICISHNEGVMLVVAGSWCKTVPPPP